MATEIETVGKDDLRECTVIAAGGGRLRVKVKCDAPIGDLVCDRSLGNKSINKARDPKTGARFRRTDLGYWIPM